MLSTERFYYIYNFFNYYIFISIIMYYILDSFQYNLLAIFIN